MEREQGGYVFSSADAAIQAAKSLGEELTLPDDIGDRKVTLKAHKDGRLVVEIERKKDEADQLEGWDDKKGKYVKIFKVKTDPKEDDELDFNEFDNIIRAVETAAVEHAGWVMKKQKEWVRHPASNVKMVLQSLGPREERGRSHHGRSRRTRLAIGQPALPRGISRRPAMESRRRPVQVQARRIEPTTRFPAIRTGT